VIDGDLLVDGTASVRKLKAGTMETNDGQFRTSIGESPWLIGGFSEYGIGIRKISSDNTSPSIVAWNDEDSSSLFYGLNSTNLNDGGGTSNAIVGDTNTFNSPSARTSRGILGCSMFSTGVFGEVFATNYNTFSSLFVEGPPSGAFFRCYSGSGSNSPGSLQSAVRLAQEARAVWASTGTIGGQSLTGGATTLSVDANGQIIRTPSDARLKTDIRPCPYGLQHVLALRPVVHKWADPAHGVESLGLIAQEAQAVIPEVVSGNEYLSVDYAKLVPVLIAAVQDLAGQLKVLQSDRKVSRSECGP
jgi:hypothetical protein